MNDRDIQITSIRISIVHYDSFDWKLKDGADINRALVYFKRTPPTHTDPESNHLVQKVQKSKSLYRKIALIIVSIEN